MVYLTGWRITGDTAAAAVDVYFSRFRPRRKRYLRDRWIAIPGSEPEDPPVAETINREDVFGMDSRC
jgi:hypothetical protein